MAKKKAPKKKIVKKAVKKLVKKKAVKKVVKRIVKKVVKKSIKRTVKKTVKKSSGNLIMFHGRECPHCRAMDPYVDRLEKELKVKVKRLEVWYNAKNAALFEKTDLGYCGGVPFFWNKKTKRYICGAVDYNTLKRWAK